jgi:hypothetical protein
MRGMDQIGLAHDRDRWRAPVNEPSDSIKCGEFIDYLRTVSFSRRTLFH